MATGDNWYLALELDFDPVPEENMSVITKRIDEKLQYWNKYVNDSKNGALFATYIHAASSGRIQADMADPQKRREMAEAAREEKFGPLDKTLYQSTKQGTKPITPDMIAKIAKMRGLDVGAVEKRARHLKIKIAEDAPAVSPEHYEAIVDEHYNKKPLKHAMFSSFKAKLDTIGCDSFYSFLFPEVQEKDRGGLTREQLYDAAEAKRKENDTGKKTPAKTQLREIAADARKAFESDEAHETYNSYLAYIKRRKEIEEILNEIENLHDKKCSRSVSDAYIIRLMSVVVDHHKARDLFVALCETKGFVYDTSEENSAEQKNLITCRCGKVNNTSDGRKVCEFCGQELWRTCPSCSAVSPSTTNFCVCGFDFSNIYKVDRISKQASDALQSFDLMEAKRLLHQAKQLYPEHRDLPALEANLLAIEAKIGSKVAEIDRQVSEGNFDQARRQFAALRQSYAQYNNPALAETIKRHLRDASDKLKEAQSKSSEDEILQLCKEAYGICRDLPGLQEYAARYTDLPLDALSVNNVVATELSASVVNNALTVRMTLPDEGETGIIVAHRFDRFPISATDAEAHIKEFSTRELAREGLLKVDSAQTRNYFIAVYLKFSVAGRSFYSPGAYCQLNLGEKVVLTYSLSKKFLSKRMTVEIIPDKAVSRIPRIDLVYSVGNAPVYVSSSKHLYTIPEQKIEGKFVCEIDLPSPLAKNTFVKPFLSESGSNYQLKLASGSSNKVS